MPLISIIIPVYKAEQFLHNCLNSILAQTFQDFEIICINDGSPDSCDQILQQYIEKDNRITVINQSNQGASIARNMGIKHAKGKYISFLDSDDSIHNQMFECCIHFLEKYNADFIDFHFRKVPTNQNFIAESKPINCEQIYFKVTEKPFDYYVKSNDWKISDLITTKIFKAKLIKDLSFIPHIYFEDNPYVAILLKKIPKVVLIKEVMYFYTTNPESIMQSAVTEKHFNSYHVGFNHIYNEYKDNLNQFDTILKNLISRNLKYQLGFIYNAKSSDRKKFLKVFADELRDIDSKKCLRILDHKFYRYIIYKFITKFF